MILCAFTWERKFSKTAMALSQTSEMQCASQAVVLTFFVCFFHFGILMFAWSDLHFVQRTREL